MLKTIRRYYWLTQKFVARHYRVILRSVSIALLASLVLLVTTRYLPASRKSTRTGMVGKYSLESLPLSIMQKVSTGLVSVNEVGDVEPALAASWQLSNEDKTYEFTIDRDKKWHDGSPVTPEDIVYNFKDVTTRHDGSKIIFELKEPFAPFMTAVSKPILKNAKIGVGEYQIDKSKSYSGVLQQISLVSDTEKLLYKFYPTESSAITALKLGEIDSLENISAVPSELASDSRIEVSPNAEDSRLVVLFFNNNDSVLSSKSTRQGLAYAIRDKSEGAKRALSPIAQTSWAYNPLVKEYDFDSERASTLFYTDIEKNTRPTIELKTTLNYLNLAEKIAEDWRGILNINVDVKVVTNISNDYQALLTDYAPPADPDQYTIWHSTQATNFTHYSNLRIDKLLEDGRRSNDRKTRTEIYQDFQRFLLEDAPAVFLFETSGFTISRKPIFQ